MNTHRSLIIFLTLALLACNSTSSPSEEIRDDFKSLYNEHQLNGSFVLYDSKSDAYIYCNKPQYTETFSPASTFKIFNSLVGLETGVIADAEFIIRWDSTQYSNKNWNRDHDLRSAFQYSAVWYYQELARRVGGEKMKYWLDKSEYGNADTSGGIDRFWLSGGLRISPKQQIEFLRKLHDNTLPFSKRSIDIVKEIMIKKDTLDYVIRAKTGWADEAERIVAWYVGYIEKGDNVYYFSNCVQSTDMEHPDFAKLRTEISYKILNSLGITKETLIE